MHEIVVAPRREHSRKPDEFYDRVREYVGPEARIAELFAVDSREAIDAWGKPHRGPLAVPRDTSPMGLTPYAHQPGENL